MIRKPRIFLSSTSAMGEEREGLYMDPVLRQGFETYCYEYDRAKKVKPREHCEAMIKSSDIFLCLVGSEFGSQLPGDETRSIVKWEYDTAAPCEDIELMAFVEEGAREDAEDPRQKEFIDELTGFEGTWCKFFSTTDQLKRLVKDSLLLWQDEFYEQMQFARRSPARKISGIMSVIVAVFLLAFFYAVYLEISGKFTGEMTFLGLCAAEATFFLGCATLTRMISPQIRK